MSPPKIDRPTCLDEYKPDAYVLSGYVVIPRQSIREISKELGMCRRTISKIKSALNNGRDRPPEQTRAKSLNAYKDMINEYFDEGLTALLIHQRLMQEQAITSLIPLLPLGMKS